MQLKAKDKQNYNQKWGDTGIYWLPLIYMFL